jgi:hypothetical protein
MRRGVWFVLALMGGVPAGAMAQQQQPEQIFVGTLRSVTRERLVMVDPSNRVYEFGVGAQTRIIGPRGEARLPQALKQGAPVRAVTREADVRNEVRFLQLLGPEPAR